MNPRYKVSRSGIELLKDFEGLRRQSAQLPDGRWTIGYGHTKSARAGVTITEADAAALLQYDLIEVVNAVNDWIFTPVTQNQFDALVCFAFNLGLEAFRASTVLRRVNEGSMLQAAWSLEMWRKAEFEGHEFVVDALVRRRAAEKALFLTPADGWVAAPSPVLPPRIDDEVCRAIPKEKPADLRATLEGSTATVTREDAPLAAAPAEHVPVEHAPIEAAPVMAAAAVTGAVAYAAETFHHEQAQPEAEPVHEPMAAPLPHQMADATQALSARLEAMVPSLTEPAASIEHVAQPVVEPRADLDLPLPPEPVAEPAPIEHVPAASAEPMLFERPVVQSRWLPDPISYPEREAVHEPQPASADLFQGPVFREEHHPDGFETVDVQPAKLGFLPFLILAFVGLIMFAGAATWAFNARSSGGMIAVGIGFALIGVGCVAWAVYALLSKVGDLDE